MTRLKVDAWISTDVHKIAVPNSMEAALLNLKAIVRSFVLVTSKHCAVQASA